MRSWLWHLFGALMYCIGLALSAQAWIPECSPTSPSSPPANPANAHALRVPGLRPGDGLREIGSHDAQ